MPISIDIRSVTHGTGHCVAHGLGTYLLAVNAD